MSIASRARQVKRPTRASRRHLDVGRNCLHPIPCKGPSGGEQAKEVKKRTGLNRMKPHRINYTLPIWKQRGFSSPDTYAQFAQEARDSRNTK